MIDVLGLIGGAGARLFVWGSDYLNKQQQHQQAMEKMKNDIALAKAQQGEAAVQALVDQLNQARAQGPVTDGPEYINIIKATIRPILTFWYCLLFYGIYKGFLLYSFLVHGQYITDVATDFDRTLISAMISYWFTDRSFQRLQP